MHDILGLAACHTLGASTTNRRSGGGQEEARGWGSVCMWRETVKQKENENNKKKKRKRKFRLAISYQSVPHNGITITIRTVHNSAQILKERLSTAPTTPHPFSLSASLPPVTHIAQIIRDNKKGECGEWNICCSCSIRQRDSGHPFFFIIRSVCV